MPPRYDPADSQAHELIPERPTLPKLREAARGCTACPLYRDATQTVFGEGPRKARVMFVGEEPGDREDRDGAPFVGPAGRLFRGCLEEAGIDRSDAYLTNTIKHFKFKKRGKRRIHQKPGAEEIAACRPWLDAELQVVKPEVLVCLGATAAQALLGRGFRVTKERGRLMPTELAPQTTATVHPSSILRAPDEEARESELRAFMADLRTIAAALQRGRG